MIRWLRLLVVTFTSSLGNFDIYRVAKFLGDILTLLISHLKTIFLWFFPTLLIGLLYTNFFRNCPTLLLWFFPANLFWNLTTFGNLLILTLGDVPTGIDWDLCTIRNINLTTLVLSGQELLVQC